MADGASRVGQGRDAHPHPRYRGRRRGRGDTAIRKRALGTITGSASVYPGLPERLELHGRDGTAIIEADRLVAYHLRSTLGDVGNYGGGAKAEASAAADPTAVGANGHTAQVADFVAAIRDHRPPAITGLDARRPLIILAIYEAAATGREVLL